MTSQEANGGNVLSNNIKSTIESDPIEAIFALNMGDFLTEHLISKDLLKKVNTSFNDKIAGLKNQLKELIFIYSLDKTLNLLGFDSDHDFIIYNSIAKTITQMLEVDTCHLYLNYSCIKNHHPDLKYDLILAGSSLESLKKGQFTEIGYYLKEDKDIIIQSFLEEKTFYFKNIKESENWAPREILKQDKTKTLLAAPMADNSECIGVLCVENYENKEITPEHIKLVEITARLFVTSMRLQRLVEEAQTLIEDKNATPMELRHLRTELTVSIGDLGDEQQMFVEALAEAVDAKSKYTREHSRKVANTARKISEYLKLNEKTIDLVYYAGLLQNIGKITLPEEIFSNTGKLSLEDWNKLQNHPNVGVSLLMKINFLSEVVPYINYHRERWNGQGEPEGLAGISIPLGSRIIAVADAYQAMISDRPYRDSLSKEKVLEIMKLEAGTKWDPIIVDALVALKTHS